MTMSIAKPRKLVTKSTGRPGILSLDWGQVVNVLMKDTVCSINSATLYYSFKKMSPNHTYVCMCVKECVYKWVRQSNFSLWSQEGLTFEPFAQQAWLCLRSRGSWWGSNHRGPFTVENCDGMLRKPALSGTHTWSIQLKHLSTSSHHFAVFGGSLVFPWLTFLFVTVTTRVLPYYHISVDTCINMEG